MILSSSSLFGTMQILNKKVINLIDVELGLDSEDSNDSDDSNSNNYIKYFLTDKNKSLILHCNMCY